jgi:hypothetical protein
MIRLLEGNEMCCLGTSTEKGRREELNLRLDFCAAVCKPLHDEHSCAPVREYGLRGCTLQPIYGLRDLVVRVVRRRPAPQQASPYRLSPQRSLSRRQCQPSSGSLLPAQTGADCLWSTPDAAPLVGSFGASTGGNGLSPHFSVGCVKLAQVQGVSAQAACSAYDTL